MLILADENIPFVQQAFGSFGEIRTLAGRDITRQRLGKAEILLVRSVTPVNAELLQGSHVRFVGTATIGTDHLDIAYLKQNNIVFANAPASNANSAAEYVISALHIIAQLRQFELQQKTVGIVGCGNVGSRVWQKLRALGVTCLVCDPPLQKRTQRNDLVSFSELKHADIITAHVPLTEQGAHPTRHLINANFLQALKHDAVFVNTSRGQVVDEQALLNRLLEMSEMTAILDVWHNEPAINPALLQRATLATPHIAGYSYDGKLHGVEMIYRALCHFLGSQPHWKVSENIAPPPVSRLAFSDSVSDSEAVFLAITSCYDVRRDDAALRAQLRLERLKEGFDELRKHYPKRREFKSMQIFVPPQRVRLMHLLQGLGFEVVLES